MKAIETERLLLRPWRDADLDPFAEMNADPRVMEHFPSTSSREESETSMVRIRGHFDRHGYGLWAVEVKGSEPFIGFVGLATVGFDVRFTPAVEIGWRLTHANWGQGYASEGARASLRFAFLELELEEVVSFTVAANRRSRAVMERIGMRRAAADDFEHPRVPDGHPLRRHIVYRLRQSEWVSARSRNEC